MMIIVSPFSMTPKNFYSLIPFGLCRYPPFLFPQFYSLSATCPHPHFLLSPQLPQAKSLFGSVPFVMQVPIGH